MQRLVIPSLLSKNESEFRAKLRTIERVASLVHIDVADGRFVPSRTWADPKVIARLRTRATFDVHLMTREPARRVAAWGKLPAVRRISVHAEATDDLPRLLAAVAKTGKDVGLALNPSTPLRVLSSLLKSHPPSPPIDAVLLMANDPGFSGRPFRRATLKRITSIRRAYPNLRVIVDIGVNLATVAVIHDAGAHEIVAGSAIFHSRNPIAAYRELVRQFT